MTDDAQVAGSLHALLQTSRGLLAARTDAAGVVLEGNPALGRAMGRDMTGEPVTMLVTEPQRPAFERALAAATPAWSSLTLGIWAAAASTAEDRVVHVCREDEGGLLVVAVYDEAGHGRLVEQVLSLNDDLIAHQRELHARQREVMRAQAGAKEAERQVRRLEAVILAGLLSSDMEGALERLLALACESLVAERAAILLLEEDARHLRVHAALGMDIVGDVTPLGTGVSGLIAATGRPMTFDDIAAADGLAEVHRRFRGSLAGVPLRLNGSVLGVLHVSTTEVGRFGDADLQVLDAVGQRAALAIGHAQLREREQRMAQTLHRSLLPQALPRSGALRLAARYLPRGADGLVGGDFYDAIELPGGRLGLAIGDVAGKGLAAAAAMGQVRAALHAYALEDERPGRVMDRLDRFVTSMDATATAMLVVADPATGELALASAGHPPLVLMGAAGAELVTGALGPPLGAGIAGRGEDRARLPEGGRLLLYTDGLVERRDEGLDAGLEALRSVAESAPRELDALCNRVLEALAPHSGWGDDVALLAARRA